MQLKSMTYCPECHERLIHMNIGDESVDTYYDEEEMNTRTDEAYNALLRRMCEKTSDRR